MSNGQVGSKLRLAAVQSANFIGSACQSSTNKGLACGIGCAGIATVVYSVGFLIQAMAHHV
jgi:hypothetical protein